jgi:hypothetical protein
MAITIENLTAKQRVFADILWGLNGKKEVTAFIESLPAKDRQEARTVLELMLLAIWDDCEDITDAQRILVDIQSR